MITEQGREYREQLIGDGYCHVPGVAPLDLIEQTRVFSERLVDGLEEDDARRRHLQGSLIRVNDLEEMVPMIILPAAIEVLNNMGFPNPKYYSGYIISKPPQSPPLVKIPIFLDTVNYYTKIFKEKRL